MFHLGMWRERMRNALTEIAEGGEQKTAPTRDEVDRLNETELARGIGTPLADAAARSDHLLTEIAELYAKVGEAPMHWFEVTSTTTAVLRNSYTHPRLHIYEYLRENGEIEAARRLFEDAVVDMKAAEAPGFIMGVVLYNLAAVRAQQGRDGEALDLLREAIEHRPDARSNAAGDSDFATLRDDPRFGELTKA